jgi:hypothetical protein
MRTHTWASGRNWLDRPDGSRHATGRVDLRVAIGADHSYRAGARALEEEGKTALSARLTTRILLGSGPLYPRATRRSPKEA